MLILSFGEVPNCCAELVTENSGENMLYPTIPNLIKRLLRADRIQL